jgi:hypothetical protein
MASVRITYPIGKPRDYFAQFAFIHFRDSIDTTHASTNLTDMASERIRWPPVGYRSSSFVCEVLDEMAGKDVSKTVHFLMSCGR